MSKKTYEKEAAEILEAVGGKDNVTSVNHCMTRLRFDIKDMSLIDDDKVKKVEGVSGVVRSNNQYQVVIGTKVDDYCVCITPLLNQNGGNVDDTVKKNVDTDTSFLGRVKKCFNAALDYLSGSLTPIIPILLVCSLCKMLASVIGPDLLKIVDANNDLYKLFTLVGTTGFYFLPIFVGYSASVKRQCSPVIGMLLGAILVYPGFIQMVNDAVKFTVYGIPCRLNDYTSSVLPIILSIWIMSYVEKFLRKHSPDILKIFVVPFGTLVIMLPIELCLLAPFGSFVGDYVCNAMISLNSVAAPLAMGLLAGTFLMIVACGMHPVLFTYLFVTFPKFGCDSFMMPAMLASSWAAFGVTLACAFKFKKRETKSLTLSYAITWLFGGVGEPLIYGLMIPYKTPIIASVVSGFIMGAVAGITHLTAYVLNTANGIYLPPAFFGGNAMNYVALAIAIVGSTIVGFICMLPLKLKED